MKTKRYFTLGSIFILLLAAFTPKVSGQNVMRLHNTPKEIIVNYSVVVDVMASDKNEIHLYGSEKALSEFQYQEKDGKLIMKRKHSSSNRRNTGKIKVKLYLRDLNMLEKVKSSYASKVIINDKITSDDISFDVSGASIIDVHGDFKKVEVDVSGASKAKIKGTYGAVELEASGASLINMIGNFTEMDSSISGASKIVCKGNGNLLRTEASGSSYFVGEGCHVSNAVLSASGASKIIVRADKYSADKSGFSVIKVIPNH